MQNLKYWIQDTFFHLISRWTPIADWQKAELDRRDLVQGDASYLSWDEVQAGIIAKHQKG